MFLWGFFSRMFSKLMSTASQFAMEGVKNLVVKKHVSTGLCPEDRHMMARRVCPKHLSIWGILSSKELAMYLPIPTLININSLGLV